MIELPVVPLLDRLLGEAERLHGLCGAVDVRETDKSVVLRLELPPSARDYFGDGSRPRLALFAPHLPAVREACRRWAAETSTGGGRRPNAALEAIPRFDDLFEALLGEWLRIENLELHSLSVGLHGGLGQQVGVGLTAALGRGENGRFPTRHIASLDFVPLATVGEACTQWVERCTRARGLSKPRVSEGYGIFHEVRHGAALGQDPTEIEQALDRSLAWALDNLPPLPITEFRLTLGFPERTSTAGCWVSVLFVRPCGRKVEVGLCCHDNPGAPDPVVVDAMTAWTERAAEAHGVSWHRHSRPNV